MNKVECHELAEKYRKELLDKIVPFWVKHGMGT